MSGSGGKMNDSCRAKDIFWCSRACVGWNEGCMRSGGAEVVCVGGCQFGLRATFCRCHH